MVRASELSDEELYREYQDAKENGPVLRIDELQLEIARRWEELHETGAIPSDSDYDLPEKGDVLFDPEAPSWNSAAHVTITEVTEHRSDEIPLEPDSSYTVAQANPSAPAGAPVVYGKYVDGSEKEYAFPVTRLENR